MWWCSSWSGKLRDESRQSRSVFYCSRLQVDGESCVILVGESESFGCDKSCLVKQTVVLHLCAAGAGSC